MHKIKNILIICTGNTARSPAAEYLAKYYAKKAGLDLRIESAGFINAFSYMQSQSRKFLESKGIDYSDFSPQLVTKELLERNNLIITMERSHKAEININYPNLDVEDKLFTLKEFNGIKKNLDIQDPYYNPSSYRKILNQIDTNIYEMIEKIKSLNKS